MFNIGDKVRRVGQNNAVYAKIGQEARVVAAPEHRSNSTLVWVNYPGCGTETSPNAEGWDRAFVVKVTEEPAYVFKLGDKGKVEHSGSVYEVILVREINGKASVVVLIAKRSGHGDYVSVRDIHGQAPTGQCRLLPPNRTIWRVTCSDYKEVNGSNLLKETVTSYAYATESTARNEYKRLSNRFNNVTVVEEVV